MTACKRWCSAAAPFNNVARLLCEEAWSGESLGGGREGGRGGRERWKEGGREGGRKGKEREVDGERERK